MRHDVVHFIYMHYLLVLDRHKKCPVPMKEIGRKGSVKLCRVPPAGLSSAERTEMYRIADHHAQGRATVGCMVSQRICHGSLCI